MSLRSFSRFVRRLARPSLAHRVLPVGVFALLAGTAQAHDGHGLLGSSHWHATDVLGFVILALAVAAAVWLGRGGK